MIYLCSNKILLVSNCQRPIVSQSFVYSVMIKFGFGKIQHYSECNTLSSHLKYKYTHLYVILIKEEIHKGKPGVSPVTQQLSAVHGKTEPTWPTTVRISDPAT